MPSHWTAPINRATRDQYILSEQGVPVMIVRALAGVKNKPARRKLILGKKTPMPRLNTIFPLVPETPLKRPGLCVLRYYIYYYNYLINYIFRNITFI